MVDLFGKRKNEDGSPSRRRLKDFDNDDELPELRGPLSTSDGEERNRSVQPSPLEELIKDTRIAGVGEKGEIMSRFDDMQDELNRLDADIAALRREGAHTRGRVQKLEEETGGKATGRAQSTYDRERERPAFIKETPVAEQALELPDLDLGEQLPTFRPFKEGEPEQELEPIPQHHAPPPTAHMPPHRPISPETHPSAPPAARMPSAKEPILTHISHDYMTLVLVMRWIEFLFERVTRDKISLVLDYYVEVGWIGEGVKSQIMSIARGEMQDVTKFVAPEEAPEDAFGEVSTPAAASYKKVEDWRLSAEDHLKSLLFIQKIAGYEVDKDKLNSLEQSIARFKQSLEGYHGI